MVSRSTDGPSGDVASPVTGGRTVVADLFDPAIIVARWARQGVDVAAYFAGMDRVELRRCVTTGYRFFHPAALSGEAAFYDEFMPADPESDYRHWSEEHDFALDAIGAGERVLDVGCGYGYFLERVREKASAVGLDGSAHARRVAAARGLDVRGESLGELAAREAASFDLVCAFQTIEHIYAVADALGGMIRLLRPGGRLIIAVPNNEPYIDRFDKYSAANTPPHHIGLWDVASLATAGRFFGLTVAGHTLLNRQRRPLVSAYLRAALWLDVGTEFHATSLPQRIAVAALAPVTVPWALYDLARTGRTAAHNLVMLFEKPC